MFRGIVIPANSTKITAVSQGYKMGATGNYDYAFNSIKEAKEGVELVAKGLVAQVPDMQTSQIKNVYAGVMTGRYGPEGSRALLQLITEQNPSIDQETYLKIQRTVEAFHDSFQASQTNLIARKQEYGKYVTATTAGIFYNWIGNYPHIHIGIPSGSPDDFQIVTSDKTQTDFKGHKAGALDLKKGPNQ